MQLFALVIFLISLCQSALLQHTFGDKWNGRFMGGELGVDVYEPYLSLSMDLRKRYTPREVENGEIDLYFQMLRNAFIPGYISGEVSAYPLLILSSSLKKEKPGAYSGFSIGGDEDYNVLQILSSEFSDPLAFSLFLGELMNFRRQVQGKPPQNGFGLMGYVVTYGPWSSFNNVIYDDNWLELKWKIKGLKQFDNKERTWNMVMGYHFHENPLFLNTIVMEVSRSLKSRSPRIRLFENTEFILQTALAPSLDPKEVWTKQQFGFNAGLFYPLGKALYLKLNAGFQKELLRNENKELVDNFRVFVTPTVTF